MSLIQKERNVLIFQHFSHEHELMPLPWPTNGEIRCRLCNSDHTEHKWFRIGYGCFKCSYFINKLCACMPQQMIKHSVHEFHPLALAKRPSISNNATCCYLCDNPLENDDSYIYSCDQCPNFYMHIGCAMLSKEPIKIWPSSEFDRTRFSCHGDYELRKSVNGDDERRMARHNCFACQRPWSGQAYRCELPPEYCKNFLHRKCAELPGSIKHPSHPRHSLELQVRNRCDLCEKTHSRFAYCCDKDGCRISLGLECILLTAVKSVSHDHALWLMDIKGAPSDSRCEGCQRSDWPAELRVTAEVNSTQHYLFRCPECDFYLHFLCGPLPTTVRYEFHVHRLRLADHSSTEDDSDEYYCDACEQVRDPFFRVYYCKECKYVAHIHCVFSEIVNETRDTKMEFRALGESRWEFGIEIANEIKDYLKPLSMSDIMARLSKEESKSLVDPFGCEDPKHKSHRVASHIHYGELNSCFDHKGISIEDISRIRQFFTFGSEELTNFRNEMHLFTPSKGLTIDDKYLRQKVENVDGYMVPKTLVPILKTLLHKYGHFGGKSNLTPNMKSVASTLLCIVIDKMCRTMVEDITKDDLKTWYFYLDAIKKISGFEVIELDSFDNFLLPTFLGFEVTRHEKEVEEKLDLEISMLEDKLKRYKENRKKLKNYASEKSDFIRESTSRASEWKRKFLGDKWF